VKVLEEELGVKLFDAVHRNTPTAAGDYLFKEGSLILAATEDVRRGIAHITGVGGGDVRFGMIDVAAIEFMPGVLSRFKKENPQIKVEAVVKTSGELMDMVERHELDFALTVTNRLPEALESITIYRDSIVAIVPSKSPQCRKKLSVKALRGEPLILYPKSSHTRMLIDDVFRKAGVVPTVNMEMHYPAAICSLVQQGMGTGLISALSAESSKLRGQVVVPILELKNARTIGVVSHRRRKLTPQAGALKDAMMKMGGVGVIRRNA
jgi:DNA-binding transcriptional LysR family regulator